MRNSKLTFFAVVAIGAVIGASTAFAADMAVKAAPIAPVALYNWSGCYVGLDAGGSWGRMHLNVPSYPFPDSSGNMSSFSGGAFGGCQYMIPSRFVFGIEADNTWMSLDNTHFSGNGGTELFHVHYDDSYSIRGRVGYSPMAMPNVLVYATGGGTWARLSQSNYLPVAGGFNSGTVDGWVAGVGAEYAFASNFILGLEYLHAEYNKTQNFIFLGPTNVTLKDIDTVRARFSYKFNWFGGGN
jgi:outer membrane immunogenic protein